MVVNVVVFVCRDEQQQQQRVQQQQREQQHACPHGKRTWSRSNICRIPLGGERRLQEFRCRRRIVVKPVQWSSGQEELEEEEVEEEEVERRQHRA